MIIARNAFLLLTALVSATNLLSGQVNPLQCVVTSGNPLPVRTEGVAEEVGQVVITCTGGTPTAVGVNIPTVNIQIFLNTNITSRLLDSVGFRSEALLLIDDPSPAEQVEATSVPNVFNFKASGNGIYKDGVRPTILGAQQASTNSLVWLNIPFDPPGDSGNRTLRIANVRANPSMLPAPGQAGINPVLMFVSISGAVVPIDNPQVTVAYAQRGIVVSATPATYNQCEPGAKVLAMKFREQFGTAFRQRSSPASQNGFNVSYNTESMFYNTAFTGIGHNAGVATQGTRLSARFTNVPANVKITVPVNVTSDVYSSASPPVLLQSNDGATLVPSGTDGSTADATTGQVALAGGTGSAVWEIYRSNPGAISTIAVNVGVAYSASPLPGLGTASFAGDFEPATTTMAASNGAAPRFIADPMSMSAFTIAACAAPPAVTLSLNRSALTFAATANGTILTPAQQMILTMAGGATTWTASSDSPWLRVLPSTGVGSGRLSVSVAPYSNTPAGTLTGKITVNAVGATNGPLVVSCTLTVKSTTTVPFGSFDTPANDLTGISGSIAVTGWALDDIGVKRVSIWRDRVGAEPVYPNGYVYIGDATFVPGARPDVEAKYSTSPNANRSGWGYMMLTNGLPAKGNGTFKLHAIAVDEEGNSFELGSKTITVDNLHSIKPFGAIDNPAPGQVISGTIVNDGWALTPQPALLAADGSTIWVSIDSVNVGHPAYGILRNDVASLFPGYANSSGSLGQYSLDSTQYANAMHTIAWILYDNLGHGDGMGSRYFHILNAGGASAGSVPAAPAAADSVRAHQLRAARLARPVTAAASYPAVRRGFDLDAQLTPIRQGGEGLLEPVEIQELGRVEIHLDAGQEWTARLRVGGELRELPIGSTFDAEGGIFYWQPGPAFLGEFVVEFGGGDGLVLPVCIRVGGAIGGVE
ncbi:MAG TPA: hypothetical protein VGK29_05500 [Paludibaculum sp.]|jgi:hypothetical protein